MTAYTIRLWAKNSDCRHTNRYTWMLIGAGRWVISPELATKTSEPSEMHPEMKVHTMKPTRM